MKKLAIVGTHTRTRDQAPWDDPEFEIWVFNEAPQADWCKRWDVDFQLHNREVYESPKNFVRGDHWEWLQQAHGKTIYMQEVDRRVPDSKRYPYEEIFATVPGADLGWFKSTPAYALALALYMGYEHIDFYGVDMRSNTEYGYQLPNFQFWIGIAKGMGIHTDVLSNEEFFTGSLYAYQGEVQIQRDYFQDRAAEIKPALNSANWEVEKIKNRIQEALNESKFSKVSELVGLLQTANLHAGEAKGALDEAERYAAREDPIPRQEFERKMAQSQKDGEQAREEMWKHSGESTYVWNVWRQTGNPVAKNQLVKFVTDQMTAALNCGYQLGKHHENARYMDRIDELITAAGGARTLAALGVAK